MAIKLLGNITCPFCNKASQREVSIQLCTGAADYSDTIEVELTLVAACDCGAEVCETVRG